MKKNNYKPRIVEFEGYASGHCYQVDTRRGARGFYPGDIVSWIYGRKAKLMVVGVDAQSNFLCMVDSDDDGRVCNIEPWEDDYELKLIKRHAQHLIDNGEMIQVG